MTDKTIAVPRELLTTLMNAADLHFLRTDDHSFRKAAEQADALLREAAQTDPPRQCVWRFDDNEHAPVWEGACGAAWSFGEDGPHENDMHYCPKCGADVVIAAQQEGE